MIYYIIYYIIYSVACFARVWTCYILPAGIIYFCTFSCDEEEDNIGDFLMSTLHEDIDINPSDNDDSDNVDGIDIVDDQAYGSEIQTTDAGAYATEVEHYTKYGGSFGNIKIAGHVILNQCGTLDYRNCPNLNFDNWRKHTPSQNLMLDDLKLNTVSVDKVTQFGLRPPELRSLFNNLGDYYRWFLVDGKISFEDLQRKVGNIKTRRISQKGQHFTDRKKYH